jgi:cyclopropane fatty-acyl-phospholipid synthase-like methyltransferase
MKEHIMNRPNEPRVASGRRSRGNPDLTVTPADFARLFGTTAADITECCGELIAGCNFRYRRLTGAERDNVILNVLKKIDSDSQVIGAPERQAAWESGWEENLQDFIKHGYDLDKLVPRFIRPNQPVRLNQDFIMPDNPNFELDYLSVLRLWLARKYLGGVDAIYEFGCGTGLNLAAIAALYPGKKLYGLDFVPSSVSLVNKLGEAYRWNVTGRFFDMLQPDEHFKLDANSAILTVGAIEQLASKFEPFLQYLLRQSPAITINIEPTVELYDENNLIDSLAVRFHRKRGYTTGFLPRLRQLEADGKIEILQVKRTFFGSLYMEGYNYMVWRPKRGA